MIASSFIIAFVATVVTERIVEPRLGKYVPDAAHAAANRDQGNLTPQDRAA
jgi:p-aminobenzoyl-glutamate transporter AbgT